MRLRWVFSSSTKEFFNAGHFLPCGKLVPEIPKTKKLLRMKHDTTNIGEHHAFSHISPNRPSDEDDSLGLTADGVDTPPTTSPSLNGGVAEALGRYLPPTLITTPTTMHHPQTVPVTPIPGALMASRATAHCSPQPGEW